MSEYLDEQREIFLSSLSSRFRDDSDSNFYKLADTIAAIFAEFKDRAITIKNNVVTIANSSSGFLDEWGFDTDVPRLTAELDDDYKTRQLSSWDRKAVVKEDLQDIVSEHSLSGPVLVEVIKDRFWLGGMPTESRVELVTTTDSATAVTVPYVLPDWSAPSIFSIGDVNLDGPNYASGGYFTSTIDASGNESSLIVLGTPVPSGGFQVKVTLTPSTSASGANVDFMPFGFFGNASAPSSYWRYNQTQNNLLKVSGDYKSLVLQTRLTPGRKAEIWTTNLPVGEIQKWEVVGPSDFSGLVTLQDTNRIDNVVKETKFSESTTTIVTTQDIARVLSVTYNGQDVAVNKRFAGKTIYLDVALPSSQTALQVAYVPTPLQNYDGIDTGSLAAAGYLDPKYALQVYFGGKFIKWGAAGKYGGGVRWGHVEGTAGTLLANAIKDAHPAGVLTTLSLVNLGSTIYGRPTTVYGLVIYRGI